MPRLLAALPALLAVLAAAPARADVTVWHSYRDDEERALVELARAYAGKAGVHVDLLAVPSDAYAAKLEAAVPRAHGPDVFIDAHERAGSFLAQRMIAPAGDAFPDDDVAAFDPTSVGAVTTNGVRYAVPLATKCVALFVNEDLLPRTPATLAAVARAEVPRGVFPIAYEAQTEYFHAPFLHAFGGAMLDARGDFAFDSPEAARSLAFVRDLVRRGAVPDEPSGALVQRLFASGGAATAISGPWFLPAVRGKVRYRVEPLPRADEGTGVARPFLTVEGAFLTPQGAARTEARAFARWLGGEEASLVRATVGRQVVARDAAWRAPELAGDRDLAAFHAAARDAVPMTTSPRMRAAWLPVQGALRKVLRGDAEPADAVREARHRFEDVTRAPPPPAAPAPYAVLASLGLVALAAFAVRRARSAAFRKELVASLPAYRYVAHAAVVVASLVVLPLLAGAATSLFAGTRDAWRFVGFANYLAILTARGGPLLGHGSFWLTLVVTVLWTVVNVTAHVAIGLVLGIALSRPFMRMKAAYRVLLIVPWAVPSYVTALAWKGMFHRQFGAVNAVLTALGAEPVSWFSRFSTAFAANVATNVWLGFPFMMVVVMGALTSIPKEVLEAAEVDGASRWQRFRLVTLPLLLPALLPSVVLGAVWTFNMFNVVYLVSGGEPDGGTDILVSEAYRWAFTREQQYGYAAAYAVLIFVLLAITTRITARLTKDQGAIA